MQALLNKTAKWHNKYVETTDSFSLKVAEILRNLATERELTQLRLAEKSGVSQAHISRVFRGERAVSVVQVHNLAKALGTTGSEIFRQAEEALSMEQSSNLVQFPSKTLKDLGITQEDLQQAAAHDTGEPIESEYEQHHWEE